MKADNLPATCFSCPQPATEKVGLHTFGNQVVCGLCLTKNVMQLIPCLPYDTSSGDCDGPKRVKYGSPKAYKGSDNIDDSPDCDGGGL